MKKNIRGLKFWFTCLMLLIFFYPMLLAMGTIEYIFTKQISKSYDFVNNIIKKLI